MRRPQYIPCRCNHVVQIFDINPSLYVITFNRYIVTFYLIILTDGCDSSQRSTDEDLYKLGIRAKGDVLALRGYCNRINLIGNISDKLTRKRTLLECIKVNRRTDNTKSTVKLKRRVYFTGYMTYNTDVRRYVVVVVVRGKWILMEQLHRKE